MSSAISLLWHVNSNSFTDIKVAYIAVLYYKHKCNEKNVVIQESKGLTNQMPVKKMLKITQASPGLYLHSITIVQT